jgi:transposase
VKLIVVQFVTPDAKSNRNDAGHAQPACKAVSGPRMRSVAVKTVEQQDIEAVHRVRAGLPSDGAAQVSQWRGLVYEYGLVAPRRIASSWPLALWLWLRPRREARCAAGG